MCSEGRKEEKGGNRMDCEGTPGVFPGLCNENDGSKDISEDRNSLNTHLF